MLSDCDEIAAMVVELLEEIMALSGSRQFQTNRGVMALQCKDWIAEGGYLILLARPLAGGSPLGFISLVETRALYAGGRFGLIPELYVRPSFRSEGVGRALMASAKTHGSSLGWARLEVTTPPLPQFERTLQFYEREGFEVAGGRKMKAVL